MDDQKVVFIHNGKAKRGVIATEQGRELLVWIEGIEKIESNLLRVDRSAVMYLNPPKIKPFLDFVNSLIKED